jgi:BR serine/threonine kinase
MSRPLTIGDYVLDKSLGAGSTSKVKLAWHQRTGEAVAVKIIKKALFLDHPELLKKVQREIAVMRLLDHPGILSLRDVFESDHHIFIIENYAANGSLYDCIQSLPKLLALSFFRQIIYGLEYLHAHRICHRDLKPENILLNGSDQIWIADFGFACWMPANLAKSSCGSPLYSAPEIIRGVPYDGRIADIWSTGVILYAMLTGTLPFTGDTVRVIAQRIRRGTFSIPPQLDAPLVDLIRGILVVDCAKRFTIAQIKAHPGFRIGLDDGYVLPTPLPLPRLLEPIEVTEADQPSLDVLEQLGFADTEDVRGLLRSPQANMAKIFFAMLTQRTDVSAIPWASPGQDAPAIDIGASFDDGQMELYRSIVGAQSFGSLTGSLSKSFPAAAHLNVDPRDRNAGEEGELSMVVRIPVVTLMTMLQQHLRANGVEFFHPNDRTLLLRRSTGWTYALTAVGADGESLSLFLGALGARDETDAVWLNAELRELLHAFVVQSNPAESAGEAG